MSKTGRASENVALFMYHSLEVPIDIIYVSTEHVLVKIWEACAVLSVAVVRGYGHLRLIIQPRLIITYN